jgi:hypothetical protein
MADLVVDTSACARYGHPEFRFVYNSDLVGDDEVRDLVRTLESEVADGARYQDGATYRIGWVVNRLRASDGDRFTIQEPDMVHSPAWWIDSVNHSLIHRRLQRGVCASLQGVGNPCFPSIEEMALQCDRFGESQGFVMRRRTEEAEDPYWVFECDDPGHDHAERALPIQLSLFEVAVSYDPRVIPYLALPPGVAVTVRPERPTFTMNGEPIEVRRGSLLDRNFPAERD